MFKTISFLTQSVAIGLVCNPMIALASEDASETAKSSGANPIAAFVALIVFFVVTYTVYKLMYSGTTIIGTRNGIAHEKGRMLFVPSIIGLIVAGVVYKVLNFLLVVLAIVAIGIGIFLIIKKFANTNTTSHNVSQSNAKSESVSADIDYMECPTCHKKILANSKFCKYCGKSV